MMQFSSGLVPRGQELAGTPGDGGQLEGRSHSGGTPKTLSLQGLGMTPRPRGALSLCAGRMREGVRVSLWV